MVEGGLSRLDGAAQAIPYEKLTLIIWTGRSPPVQMLPAATRLYCAPDRLYATQSPELWYLHGINNLSVLLNVRREDIASNSTIFFGRRDPYSVVELKPACQVFCGPHRAHMLVWEI